MSKPKWYAVVEAVVVILLAQPLLANGVIRDGVGARSSGRGGTNIAHSDNAAILLDNPAGMMNIGGRGLMDLSLDAIATNVHYEDAFSSDTGPVRPLGLPEFGLIHKSRDGCWAYGFGIDAPAGFAGHFSLEDPFFGRQKYSSFGALVKILPALAYQVNDRLSVGGTLGVGVSRATFHGPYFIQTAPFAGAPAVVDIKSTGATMIWSLGAQYQLSERTRLGLVYQSESRCTLRGDATVDVLAPVTLNSDFDVELDLTWPRSVGFGVRHDLFERSRLSTDLIWINWSSAFDAMGMRLDNPSNAAVPGLLGPTLSDQFPLQWDDSISARVGYEYFPSPCSVWRAGYVFNLNQVPDATLTTYIPATLEHAFTVGWGCTRGPCSFDIAYQYSFGPRRHVETSALVGGDFSSSEINAQAHWLSLGLTWQY